MGHRAKTPSLVRLGRRLALKSAYRYKHHVDEIPKLILHIAEFEGRNCCLLGFLIIHPCVRPCADGLLQGGEALLGAIVNFLLQLGRIAELKDHTSMIS